jgi:hypothetical protein
LALNKLGGCGQLAELIEVEVRHSGGVFHTSKREKREERVLFGDELIGYVVLSKELATMFRCYMFHVETFV